MYHRIKPAMATLKPLGVHKVAFTATHILTRTNVPVVIIGQDRDLFLVMTAKEENCWVEKQNLKEVA